MHLPLVQGQSFWIRINYKLTTPPPTSHSLIYSQDKVLSQEGHAAIFLCPHGVSRRGLLLLHCAIPSQEQRTAMQLFCLTIT